MNRIKELLAIIITSIIILCAMFYSILEIDKSYDAVARLKPYETKSKVLENRVEYLEDYLTQLGYKF